MGREVKKSINMGVDTAKDEEPIRRTRLYANQMRANTCTFDKECELLPPRGVSWLARTHDSHSHAGYKIETCLIR
jgi:hypothetical protein